MNRARILQGILGSLLLFTFSVRAQGPGMGPGGGFGHGPGSGYENFPGWRGMELEHNLILPQVAVGEGVTMTLILNNMGGPQRMGWLEPEDYVTTGTIHFFDSSGADLPVRINGQAGSEFPFSLQPSEVLFLDVTPNDPGLRVGWLLLEVDDSNLENSWGLMDGHPVGRGERVMVTAYYSISDAQGSLASQVSVMPGVFERGLFLNSVVTAQFDNGLRTGVALVNPGDLDVAMELRLTDATGRLVATEQFTLPAGNQRARFVDELFTEVPNGFRGVLEIRGASQGVVSMGLLQSGSVLTSLPVHHYGNWTPN